MKTLKLAAALALGLLFGLMTIPQANATGPWTGCGLAGAAGLIHGGFDAGGGIDVGAKGEKLDIAALCDLQMDRVVIGGFVEYGRVFGDLHDFGIDADWTVGARAGLLVTPNTLFYGHGDWTRVQASGLTFNGWKAGLGTEMKLPTTAPLFIDVRYSHGWYDNVASSGINASSDEVRVGLTWKFMSTPVAVAPLK